MLSVISASSGEITYLSSAGSFSPVIAKPNTTVYTGIASKSCIVLARETSVH
jgi:hypothetical protein